jgi:hypothetical protein
MRSMTYNHTQYGRWHYLFHAYTLAALAGTFLVHSVPPVVILLLVTAVIFALCGLMFGSLTIRDEGEWLSHQFGPLPVFRKKIRYADITSVEAGRTRIIDGWGSHYIPGRGWTYNLWGCGCVKLSLGRKVVRVGSDDEDNLVRFLRNRLAGKPPEEPLSA